MSRLQANPMTGSNSTKGCWEESSYFSKLIYKTERKNESDILMSHSKDPDPATLSSWTK